MATIPTGLTEEEATRLSSQQQSAIQQNLPQEGQAFLLDIGEGGKSLATIRDGKIARLSGFENFDNVDFGGRTIGQLEQEFTNKTLSQLGLSNLQTPNIADFGQLAGSGNIEKITDLNQFQSLLTGGTFQSPNVAVPGPTPEQQATIDAANAAQGAGTVQAAGGIQETATATNNPFFGIDASQSGRLQNEEQARQVQALKSQGMTDEQAVNQVLGSTTQPTEAGVAEIPTGFENLTKISNPEQLREIASALGISPDNESQFLERDSQGNIYLKPEALSALSESDVDVSGLETEDPVQSMLDKYGVSQPEPGTNPTVTFADTYKQLVNDLGLPTIKDAFNEVQTEYNDLQLELNDKIADINDNPWLTEGARVQRINKLKERYEGREGILTAQLKLYNSLYEQGLAEARFVAGATQNQAQFDTNTQIKLLQLAQDEAEALADLKKLDTSVVTVGGRKQLIDNQTGDVIRDLGPSTTGGGGGGSISFTSTERKKLEQAGLLNSDRQTQLDYLYGSEGTNEAEVRFYVDSYLQGNEDLVNDDGSLNLTAVPQDLRANVYDRIVQEESIQELNRGQESQGITFGDVAKQIPSALSDIGTNIKSFFNWF